MDLYWFMPALAKSRVGSECGTTEDEGTVASQQQYQSTRFLGDGSTKLVPILLEELYKGIPYFHGIPLSCHPGRESAVCPVEVLRKRAVSHMQSVAPQSDYSHYLGDPVPPKHPLPKGVSSRESLMSAFVSLEYPY